MAVLAHNAFTLLKKKDKFKNRTKNPNADSLNCAHLFVFSQFLLKLQNFLSQQSGGSAVRSYKVKTRYCNKSHNLSLNINYLIENDPILDVPRPVGVLERVERFHKVAVGRRAARNHQGAAITCEIVQKIKHVEWATRFIDRVPPSESCKSRVSFESR